MKWPTTSEIRALVPLPKGYQFERFEYAHIVPLIANIKRWYPQIAVGANSGYLREDYYLNRVTVEGGIDRDIIVLPITFSGEVIGVLSFEREVDSLAIYGRTMILAPEHRGANLAGSMMIGTEAIGRTMGAAFMYALATLRIPQAQRALESAGYRLLGFFPGYDREEVSPGVIKRVYQAVYAKLLVPDSEILMPDPQKMTPRASALFALLFADAKLATSHDSFRPK
jgi:hypothetical protein